MPSCTLEEGASAACHDDIVCHRQTTKRAKAMSPKLTSIALFISLAASAQVAAAPQWEGPFGLKKGLTQEQLASATKGLKLISPGYYTFDAAPATYPGVDQYLAVVGPKTGLCKVMASFSLRHVSAYGEDIKDQVSRLSEALTEKYGKPTRIFDYLKPGSIWDKPNDWYMGLYKKERVLQHFWLTDPTRNGKPLPNMLSAITIKATARGGSGADVDLAYEFDNIDECFASLKSADNAAL